MSPQANKILRTVARELKISEEELVKQGLRSFVERQLREVKAEIFELSGRYGVSSVEEMEARYRDGTLEEADSWRDLQRLDHLEYKQDRLVQLLEVIV
jgi:hypothetical protein